MDETCKGVTGGADSPIDASEFITIDDIDDELVPNCTDNSALIESLPMHSEAKTCESQNAEAVAEMVTIDEVYDSDHSTDALVIAEESVPYIETSKDIKAKIEVCHNGSLSINHGECNSRHRNGSDQDLPSQRTPTPSLANADAKLIVVDDINENDNCRPLAKPSTPVDNSQPTTLSDSSNEIARLNEDGSRIPAVGDVERTKATFAGSSVPEASVEAKTNGVSIDKPGDQIATQVGAISSLPETKPAGTTTVAITSTTTSITSPKPGLVAADEKEEGEIDGIQEQVPATSNTENEKEEGEITSDEEEQAPSNSSRSRSTKQRRMSSTRFSITSRSKILPPPPPVTRWSSYERSDSRKSKRPSHRSSSKDTLNYSFDKMLVEHKVQRRRASDDTADSLRVLRIAALRSVAKGQGKTAEKATDKPSNTAAILDSSTLTAEDIATAVTELPTMSESKISAETPSAKLKRKQKWQALAQSLTRKISESSGSGSKSTGAVDVICISDDDSTSAKENADTKPLPANTKQSPPELSDEVSLEEVLHMSLNTVPPELEKKSKPAEPRAEVQPFIMASTYSPIALKGKKPGQKARKKKAAKRNADDSLPGHKNSTNLLPHNKKATNWLPSNEKATSALRNNEKAASLFPNNENTNNSLPHNEKATGSMLGNGKAASTLPGNGKPTSSLPGNENATNVPPGGGNATNVSPGSGQVMNKKTLTKNQKTALIMTAIANLGDSSSEKVIQGVQVQNIPVSRMSLAQLKTELAKISQVVLNLFEQIKTMKNGKGKTKKKTRIAINSAYKEKLHELVNKHQSRRSTNPPSDKRATSRFSRRNSTENASTANKMFGAPSGTGNKRSVTPPGTGSKIASTGSKMTATGSKMTSTGSNMAGTGSKMAGTGSKMAGTGSKMAGAGSKMTGTGSNMSGALSNMVGAGSNISGTGSNMAGTGSNMAGTGSNMAGISNILTLITDPKKQYEMFMSRVGDQHNIVAVSDSQMVERQQLAGSPSLPGSPGVVGMQSYSLDANQLIGAPIIAAHPAPPITSSTAAHADRQLQTTAAAATASADMQSDTDRLRMQALMSISIHSQKKAADTIASATSSVPAMSPKKPSPSTPNRVVRKKTGLKKDVVSPLNIAKAQQVTLSPKVQPLIIHLGDDSSSDEDVGAAATMSSTIAMAVPAGLDSMLKECRQQAAPTKQAAPQVLSPTSASINLLPVEKQEEYRKLKELKEAMKLKNKQIQRTRKAASSVASTVSRRAKDVNGPVASSSSKENTSKAPAVASAVTASGSSTTAATTVSVSTSTLTNTTTANKSVSIATSTASSVVSTTAVTSITSSSTIDSLTTSTPLPQPTQPTNQVEGMTLSPPTVALSVNSASVVASTDSVVSTAAGSAVTDAATTTSRAADFFNAAASVQTKPVFGGINNSNKAALVLPADSGLGNARFSSRFSNESSPPKGQGMEISDRHKVPNVDSVNVVSMTKPAPDVTQPSALPKSSANLAPSVTSAAPPAAATVDTGAASFFELAAVEEHIKVTEKELGASETRLKVLREKMARELKGLEELRRRLTGLKEKELAINYRQQIKLLSGSKSQTDSSSVTTDNSVTASVPPTAATQTTDEPLPVSLAAVKPKTDQILTGSDGTKYSKAESVSAAATLGLADVAQTYEPTSSSTHGSSSYNPTPIAVKVEGNDAAYEPELADTGGSSTVAYQPTPIRKRAVTGEAVGEAKQRKEVADGDVGERTQRMKALERALSIKLRSKYIKKRSMKAATKSGDVIPVPKLEAADIDEQPLPKRRRSLLEPPSPKSNDKDVSEPSTSAAVNSGPIVRANASVSKQLMEEMRTLPHFVQQLRSDMERLKVLHEIPVQAAPDTKCSVRVLTATEDHRTGGMYKNTDWKYSSVLKVFSTYRLNPYVRQQEKLSPMSSTYNNAINCRTYLCKYDLHGTCNDSSCDLQHERSYKLSLVSSVEKLRSINPLPFPDTAVEFIRRCRSTQPKGMSDEQIMVLAASQVRGAVRADLTHTIQFDVPAVQDSLSDTAADSVPHGSRSQDRGATGSDILSDDDIMFCTDTRYYLDNASTMEEMERTLMEDPSNVNMWLKLAYKKLHENRHSTQAVNEALHIVSLALESNSTNLDLWLFYLKLYGKQRAADRTDYADVCEKALEKQACYQMFVMYISSLPSVKMKLEACNHMKTFLAADQMMSVEEKSFAMLQSLLYSTSLALMAGYPNLSILKNIMSRNNEERHLLTKSDWLLAVYYSAYVTAFQSLPPSLLRGGVLTSREALPVNWSNAILRPSTQTEVKRMLYTALAEIKDGEVLDCSSHWVVRRAILELENRLEAGSICRRWYTEGKVSNQPEFYLMYLEYQTHTDPLHFRKLCHNCIHTLPKCSKVYYYISLWTDDYSARDISMRLEFVTTLIYSLFGLSMMGEGAIQHADYLYRVFLDLEHPNKPRARPVVDRSSAYKGNLVYCWLCYGYYLEVSGADTDTIIDMYETAMCRLTDRDDVQLVCWRYIECRRKLATDSAGMKEYLDVVSRCLSAMPVQLLSPANRSYTDYCFHNKVIRYVADALHPSDVTAWYEQWMHRYPDNIELIPRLCDCYMQRMSADYVSIKHICRIPVLKSIASEALWNLCINATIQLKRRYEALSLARQAVKLLPHSLMLWKKYLTIMLSVATPASDIRRAVQECKDTDVNIEQFLQALPIEARATLH